jgi:hypothetical protein
MDYWLAAIPASDHRPRHKVKDKALADQILIDKNPKPFKEIRNSPNSG